MDALDCIGEARLLVDTGFELFDETYRYTPKVTERIITKLDIAATAIAALTAERDAALALGIETAANVVPPHYFNHDEEWAAWRAAQHLIRAAAPVTPLKAALALPEVRELATLLRTVRDRARQWENGETSPNDYADWIEKTDAALAKLEATK